MNNKQLVKSLGCFFIFSLQIPFSVAQHHTMQDSMANHNQHNMMAMPNNNDKPLLEQALMPKGQPLKPLPLLVNQSKQKGVFEARLMPMPTQIEVIPGKQTTFWLYNQTLLPIIDVMAGTKVKVAVENHLPEGTTVHWHGLSISPQVDGNPHDPIKVGEKRVVEFTLPNHFEGTYWFHPHPHETTAKQVYKGLAGGFIVRDPNDPLKAIPEQNLFFSDLKLDKDAQIADNSMLDWMNGREGQFQLINAQYQPIISLEGTQRWRIWNGNSGRYLNLSFPSNEVEAYQVASDGGLLEKPVAITSLLLSPGERAEVVLTPKKQGEFTLTALAYERGKMGNVAKEKDLPLAQVKMTLKDKITLPEHLRDIPKMPVATAYHKIEYTEVANPESLAGMDFLINGQKYDMSRIDYKVKAGAAQEWEIFNNSHMDHSFHLHGPQFQVKEFELAGKITKPLFRELKDTINLKPYEKARIVFVDYDKGIRMYHCHILEHETLGMMGQVENE